MTGTMRNRTGEEHFWMVKTKYLAPYYGISRHRSDLKDAIKSLPNGARIVQVAVKEIRRYEIRNVG